MCFIQDTVLLRKHLRLQRRRLNNYQQYQAESSILRYLYTHHRIKSAQHIGIYLHAFGEISTQRLMYTLSHFNKQLYLPQICPMNQQLYWVNCSLQQYKQRRFVRHVFNMFEPKGKRGRSVQHLDIIFMPLLACDYTGMRLGMGGGFYDRTLATAPYKPYRIGLAHDFQYLTQRLPSQPWDQPLHELWTPKKRIVF